MIDWTTVIGVVLFVAGLIVLIEARRQLKNERDER